MRLQTINESKKKQEKTFNQLAREFKMLFSLFHTFFLYFSICFYFVADPKFSGPILNATVAVGRDAVLTCMVEDLGAYKVSFVVCLN